MHNSLTPPYLTDILPPKRRLLYGKTNPNIYESIRCKSTRYKNSFLDFHESVSLETFKHKINCFIRPLPKSIFGIHNPKGLRCLFQLRVGLSPLRYDKRRHNFVDTPSNICECVVAPEDTKHFLFFCTNFQAQRVQLMDRVSPILQNYDIMHNIHNPYLFLYGDESVPNSDNKIILESTLNYILKTGKFGT